MSMNPHTNRRVLAIDDQLSILEDFRKILCHEDGDERALDDTRSALFGGGEARQEVTGFELHVASQGREGIDLLADGLRRKEPFAVAFVDVRMPPGLDGMRTVKGLWELDPDLQVVICTAYSDYSYEEIVETLGRTDRLLILKKPFDPVEVRQMASALCEKWSAEQRERERLRQLEEAEREARRRADELARANERLAEANERAEAASRAKSEFLANMSHEIRTPMNALLGYVELLSDHGISPEERAQYGETVRQSGEHLLTILGDILDISQIEASRMVVHKTDFDPFDLAHDVVSLMTSQAAEKDLSLELVVPDAIPTVIEADKVRVRQILLNLVGNAIKFTPKGYVKLVVRLDDNEQSELRSLYFDVVDTGIGIHESDLGRVFESFHQLDSSLTRTAGGTGLGLSIARRLARMMGGDIEVESEPGAGSTFSLRLFAGAIRPGALRSYSLRDCEVRGARGVARPVEPGELHGRVLLVEDVKFNQVLVTAVLRKAGAEVEVAENGAVALERALAAEEAGSPFDIVLMDMQMPVMDGYEATRRLRAEGYERPIVALTAHAMKEDRERCLAAGCTDYATKPLDRRSLLETCRRLVSEATPAPLPSRAASDADARTGR